jgi:hypothetical protein
MGSVISKPKATYSCHTAIYVVIPPAPPLYQLLHQLLQKYLRQVQPIWTTKELKEEDVVDL